MASYDDKSYELAEYFLDGWTHESKDIDLLAQRIQGAVEDWFSENEQRVKEK